jgi:hypothetical protein
MVLLGKSVGEEILSQSIVNVEIKIRFCCQEEKLSARPCWVFYE